MSQRAEHDLWRYHAYVYALRKVKLGISDKTSPVDPGGDWHHPEMLARAERFYRAKFSGPRPVYSAVETGKDREATEARERWARECGCDSFKQAMAIGLRNVARRHMSGPSDRAEAS